MCRGSSYPRTCSLGDMCAHQADRPSDGRGWRTCHGLHHVESHDWVSASTAKMKKRHGSICLDWDDFGGVRSGARRSAASAGTRRSSRRTKQISADMAWMAGKRYIQSKTALPGSGTVFFCKERPVRLTAEPHMAEIRRASPLLR